MTDKLIRRFQVRGTTSSNKLEYNQNTLRKLLIYSMNIDGYAPLLDVDPVWTWSWAKDEEYDFVYTWQGVFVGKDVAWQTEGVSNGKRIPYTPSNKSLPS
jgi:hypothetical protein